MPFSHWGSLCSSEEFCKRPLHNDLQYTILIDVHLQPWLDISYVSWMADVSTEEAKAGEAADGLALTDLFEKWLPEEVAKARNA